MATLIRPDGTIEAVHPGRGNTWTLDELQRLVGDGPIELMPGVEPHRLVLNEEGVVRGLPFNATATALVQCWLAGQRLWYLPQIVGPVLLLEWGERL
jgi:hypothetical protein